MGRHYLRGLCVVGAWVVGCMVGEVVMAEVDLFIVVDCADVAAAVEGLAELLCSVVEGGAAVEGFAELLCSVVEGGAGVDISDWHTIGHGSGGEYETDHHQVFCWNESHISEIIRVFPA